jgi:hypothetical protein
MTRIILIVLAGLLVVLPASAEPAQGVGFAAGQLSGIGLSYRVMLEDYGFQVTVGGISLKDSGYEESYPTRGYYDPDYPKNDLQGFTQEQWVRETDANIGLMFMKSLHHANKTTLYVFTGFCAFFSWDTIEEQYYEPVFSDDYYDYVPIGDPKTRVKQRNIFYGGGGLGFEIRFTPNVRLAIEWPLTFTSDGDFVMYIPQAGLHYFF